MDVHKIDWSAIPWTPVRQGVERKAFSGEGATVALHRLMRSRDVAAIGRDEPPEAARQPLLPLPHERVPSHELALVE